MTHLIAYYFGEAAPWSRALQGVAMFCTAVSFVAAFCGPTIHWIRTGRV